jgi:DNA-binding response OmpR family regulator
MENRRFLPTATQTGPSPLLVIAEDHTAIRELLSLIINMMGYRCLALSRKMLFSWLQQEQCTMPLLLLLDVSMGEKEAVSLVQQVQWHCWMHSEQPLALLLLTTNVALPEQIEGYPVLYKPFRVHHLQACVRRHYDLLRQRSDEATSMSRQQRRVQQASAGSFCSTGGSCLVRQIPDL